MTNSVKTPKPSSAPFDSQFEKEESRVRARTSDEEATRVAAARQPAGARNAPATETVGERTSRIEHKMAIATLLLRRLSPTDARARLLASAVLRRDEVLLDAVLAQMTDEVVGLVSEKRPHST